MKLFSAQRRKETAKPLQFLLMKATSDCGRNTRQQQNEKAIHEGFKLMNVLFALPPKYKSLGIDQIPAELIKARGRTICCEIHKLIISIWNKEELLREEWKESIILPIYKKGDKTDCSKYREFCLLFCMGVKLGR
jgi:hypothetical protein